MVLFLVFRQARFQPFLVIPGFQFSEDCPVLWPIGTDRAGWNRGHWTLVISQCFQCKALLRFVSICTWVEFSSARIAASVASFLLYFLRRSLSSHSCLFVVLSYCFPMDLESLTLIYSRSLYASLENPELKTDTFNSAIQTKLLLILAASLSLFQPVVWKVLTILSCSLPELVLTVPWSQPHYHAGTVNFELSPIFPPNWPSSKWCFVGIASTIVVLIWFHDLFSYVPIYT